MNNDDDTFFEDEDADETLSAEDIAEDEEEEEKLLEEIVDIAEVRPYDAAEPGDKLAKFLADPWPLPVFIITLIGLAIILFTPPAIWAPNRYMILGVYFLVIAAFVGIVFSLKTWTQAGTHRLRWAGPVNIIVIVLSLVIGTIDTIRWILTGVGLFPALDSPLLLLCFMLVFFSMYMLWMIQKSLDPEPR
jgi:hypothetical protein